MQLNLFPQTEKNKPSATPPIIHLPKFLSQSEADALFNFCKTLNWHQNVFKIYGKEILIPRQEYLEGVPGACYSYSGGVTLTGQDWSPELKSVRDRIFEATGYQFQIVIGNWYADGSQHIGWHADDDKSLGAMPAIASLSLGASRKFQIRQKGKCTAIQDFQLDHGALIIMKPGMQENWLHRLPQAKSVTRDRINLTFRPYVSRKESAIADR